MQLDDGLKARPQHRIAHIELRLINGVHLCILLARRAWNSSTHPALHSCRRSGIDSTAPSQMPLVSCTILDHMRQLPFRKYRNNCTEYWQLKQLSVVMRHALWVRIKYCLPYWLYCWPRLLCNRPIVPLHCYAAPVFVVNNHQLVERVVYLALK
jgi:hypothetical protein